MAGVEWGSEWGLVEYRGTGWQGPNYNSYKCMYEGSSVRKRYQVYMYRTLPRLRPPLLHATGGMGLISKTVVLPRI